MRRQRRVARGHGRLPAPPLSPQVNQVRGLHDVSILPTLTTLEFLSLYGLPAVTELPSLSQLGRLRRAELGSMKGLSGLTGLHDAPALKELLLIRAVRTGADDARRPATHPTLREFERALTPPVRHSQPGTGTI